VSVTNGVLGLAAAGIVARRRRRARRAAAGPVLPAQPAEAPAT
jgi:hypothetical protein